MVFAEVNKTISKRTSIDFKYWPLGGKHFFIFTEIKEHMQLSLVASAIKVNTRTLWEILHNKMGHMDIVA